MRLFILATPFEPSLTSLANEKLMDIIQAGAEYPSISIYVISDQFSPSFVAFCKPYALVHLLTIKEAQLLLKSVTNEIFIHFGATIQGADKQKIYFIPLSTPGSISPLSFFSKYWQEKRFLKFIAKAKQVIYLNEWFQEQLESKFPTVLIKGKLTYLPSSGKPIFEWHQLAATKEALADGYPYFLAIISVANFIDTLKEFSIFKKWQQSTMRLVFVFDNLKDYEQASTLLKGYKYKEDIHLIRSHDLGIDGIAAAYLILWQGIESSKTSWIESAIHYDVPLLFDAQLKMPEQWQKAGEVFSFIEKGAISNHFKLYYKDEVYRHARARMGKAWIESTNTHRASHSQFKWPTDFG